MGNNSKIHKRLLFVATCLFIILVIVGTLVNLFAIVIGLPVLFVVWYLIELPFLKSDMEAFKRADYAYGVATATFALIPLTFLVGVLFNISACNIIKMPKYERQCQKEAEYMERLERKRVERQRLADQEYEEEVRQRSRELEEQGSANPQYKEAHDRYVR